MKIDKKWYGSDANQITSLFEYSFLAKRVKNNVLRVIVETPIYSDTPMWRKSYKIVNWSKKYSLEKINESWFDKPGFLNFCGLSQSGWMRIDTLIQLQDLCSYYGTENIIGFNYWPLGIRDVIRKITPKQN